MILIDHDIIKIILQEMWESVDLTSLFLSNETRIMKIPSNKNLEIFLTHMTKALRTSPRYSSLNREELESSIITSIITFALSEVYKNMKTPEGVTIH